MRVQLQVVLPNGMALLRGHVGLTGLLRESGLGSGLDLALGEVKRPCENASEGRRLANTVEAHAAAHAAHDDSDE